MQHQWTALAKVVCVAAASGLGLACSGQTEATTPHDHAHAGSPGAAGSPSSAGSPGTAGSSGSAGSPSTAGSPSSAGTLGSGGSSAGAPSATDEMADPGAPDTEFGTKGEAHLFVGSKEVGYIFFSALAPAQADLAHVFFVPEPNASVDVTDYYVSLVLERAAWRTGTYSGALGGRATIKLSSGVEYQSEATKASVSANVAKAPVIEGDVYLDGNLTMSLPSKSGGEPLRVEVKFN